MTNYYYNPEISVQLDTGSIATLSNVVDIQVSIGLEQDNGTATVRCTSLHGSATEGTLIYIYGSSNGSPAILFNGEITGISYELESGLFTLDCQDIFSRLSLEWGGADRVYTNQTDAAVIQNLVEATGINPALTSIASSGWSIGVVQDVVLKTGDRPIQVIRQIDSCAGYATFPDGNGAVTRRAVALGASAATITQGTNLLRGSRKRSKIGGVANKVIVKGLVIAGVPVEATYSAASAIIPTPPQYITATLDSAFIEDNTKALEIATRLVGEKNKIQNTIELTIPLHSTLSPADTITVTAARLELSGQTLFVTGLRHSIQGNTALTTIQAKML